MSYGTLQFAGARDKDMEATRETRDQNDVRFSTVRDSTAQLQSDKFEGFKTQADRKEGSELKSCHPLLI